MYKAMTSSGRLCICETSATLQPEQQRTPNIAWGNT